ncbi:hypothetical protein Bca52824_018237 [Brassica carinata]|uniref:Uncharacterized protein n=1 Tax=Brassica carinata TaxID=52824 RepID=A0A8X8AX80_BRACI|nr:hypothetical protein Bca52824_018237 [Brassica carinata]
MSSLRMAALKACFRKGGSAERKSGEDRSLRTKKLFRSRSDKEEAELEKAQREFNETRSSDLAELESCKDSMKNLKFVVDTPKEKADLERAKAAELMKHLRKQTAQNLAKYEVTR